MIHGSATAWDGVTRSLILIPHLKHSYGDKLTKLWLDHPDRRTVNLKDVVFDPAGDPADARRVNLFQGMPLKPDADKACERIVELVHYLCNDDDKVTDWVMKWAALPLKRVGAKLDTAVVMHGEEGTGKNMFWTRVVRQIYGSYGAVVTQDELENPFNSWASHKLFLIGNEVVAPHEMRHLKGKLKNYITEPDIPINEKFLPFREEANHMNIVFLSNELRPVPADPRDRRYMIIRTPEPREAAFYKAVGDEIAAGGVAGFYAYLLAYDLGDFDEHTKPLPTRARADVIFLGLPAPQRFYIDWSEEQLPIPYCSCSLEQLFEAFRIWCVGAGERNPLPQHIFSAEIARKLTREQRTWVADPARGRRQTTMFLVGECPNDYTQEKWLGLKMGEFNGGLRSMKERE